MSLSDYIIFKEDYSVYTERSTLNRGTRDLDFCARIAPMLVKGQALVGNLNCTAGNRSEPSKEDLVTERLNNLWLPPYE